MHATAQVVSFETDRPLDPDRLRRSLNRLLGPEIAVVRIAEALPTFHARFSATGRAYRYLVLDREVHDPLLARTVLHVPEPLDVAAMDRAVAPLVGEHDFAAFCRRREGASTLRRVRWAGWRRAGELAEFSIGATAFCHQMVRSIVAACLDVGLGRLPEHALGELLASRDRSLGRGAAPPHGLALVGVGYPGEELEAPEWIESRG